MKAINAGDWDLCKELARFLTSFDSMFSQFAANCRYGEHVASSTDSCWPPCSIFDTFTYESTNIRLHANHRTDSYEFTFDL